MSGTLPPKRNSSLEMTAVIPRASLAPKPISASDLDDLMGPTPEQIADIEQAHREAARSADTLVSCPNCEHCGVCGGMHMVSAERAAEFRREQAADAEPRFGASHAHDLDNVVDMDPPDSRPEPKGAA